MKLVFRSAGRKRRSRLEEVEIGGSPVVSRITIDDLVVPEVQLVTPRPQPIVLSQHRARNVVVGLMGDWVDTATWRYALRSVRRTRQKGTRDPTARADTRQRIRRDRLRITAAAAAAAPEREDEDERGGRRRCVASTNRRACIPLRAHAACSLQRPSCFFGRCAVTLARDYSGSNNIAPTTPAPMLSAMRPQRTRA
jgi:hypothetical protein